MRIVQKADAYVNVLARIPSSAVVGYQISKSILHGVVESVQHFPQMGQGGTKRPDRPLGSNNKSINYYLCKASLPG